MESCTLGKEYGGYKLRMLNGRDVSSVTRWASINLQINYCTCVDMSFVSLVGGVCCKVCDNHGVGINEKSQGKFN